MRRGLAALVALAALFLLAGCGGTMAETISTGFDQPYLGTPRYAHLAPPLATNAEQVNEPLGQEAADAIAAELGLDKQRAFSAEQYQQFISGDGVGGQQTPAQLVRESLVILSNVNGSPINVTVDGVSTPTVLASYGLYVNSEGMLMSPAVKGAPTSEVNEVLKPGGYLFQWCKQNGAEATLAALLDSGFTREAVYGAVSQKDGGTAQLVTNQKGLTTSTVGMPMAPSIWITNFALMYMLSPQAAAQLPAYWSPIPEEVATALRASPTGQVPYADYRQYFPGS